MTITTIGNGTEYGRILSSHFLGEQSSQSAIPNKCWIGTNGTAVYFTHSSLDITAWKNYLAGQNAAGTPVQVLYELAVPKELQISSVAIPALAGLNTIYTDGGGDTSSQLNPFGSLLSQLSHARQRITALEKIIAG